MPFDDPMGPLDVGHQASTLATARRVLLIAFYVAILISMAVVIWFVSPRGSPKLVLVFLAWGLLIGRVYLEVRLRRSTWARVLRLTSTPSTRH